MLWNTFKKGFDRWESKTADVLEHALKSPVLLWPGGLVLGKAMKLKSAYDGAMAGWTGGVLGLATKRDQERALHALNQIESRLMDLEERLDAQLEKKQD